jgi:hypothetical protein
VPLPVPGAFSAALRAGANLAPGNRSGGQTFAQFLAVRRDAANADRAAVGRLATFGVAGQRPDPY